MTYSDFLDTLIAPIRMFIDGLTAVATSLSANYIFITILGIVLFTSLFWLFVDILNYFFFRKLDYYDEKREKYKDYQLYQEVKKDYLAKHSYKPNSIDSAEVVAVPAPQKASVKELKHK